MVRKGFNFSLAGLVALLLGAHVLVFAQGGGCALRVTDSDGGLPFATVRLNGLPVGATDLSGRFVIPAQATGGGVGTVDMVGYATATFQLSNCIAEQVLDVRLEPATVACGAATVVGGMSAMRLKDSPIVTTMIAGKALEAVHAQDLVESIDFTNGVRETVACGICGTNDVHINGMEGVYTLVLIDGVPLLGGLASAYALDGIPMSMVQQVEIVQGPASARFGSQAVGGVINVVTTAPRAGEAGGMVRWDAHGRSTLSAQLGIGTEEAPWQIGLDGVYFDRRLDDNGDGMTDAPNIKRITGTLRHQRQGEVRRNKWMARTYAEERFGGDVGFQEGDRGGTDRYGESIDVHRSELIWSSTPRAEKGLRLAAGAAFHRQASTYGVTEFIAKEWTTNLEAYHPGWSWREGHRLSGGTSLMWDVYRDETEVDSDFNTWVPAAYVEYAGKVTDAAGEAKWTWIHGLRAEWPTGEGLILAPRFNLKWAPAPVWGARFNAGRGYRRVHLFTEEHAALDGSRVVLVDEDGLNPERSWNINLNVDREVGRENWTGRLSVHAFSTWFSERIYADFDSLPNAVLYRNIDGMGWNRGVGADAWWSNTGGWEASLGGTWLRSELYEGSARWGVSSGDPIEFAPVFTSNLMVAWSQNHWGFSCTGQTVGRMKIPHYSENLPVQSSPYALIHGAVERHMNTNHAGLHTVTLGVQNVTNWTQPNPLIGSSAPFSEAFDASRIYGPLEGRRFFVEWSWSL